MAAASYHLRILSPKYGQMCNVKPLTANRSLSFAVNWSNLDVKVSTVNIVVVLRKGPRWPPLPPPPPPLAEGLDPPLQQQSYSGLHSAK